MSLTQTEKQWLKEYETKSDVELSLLSVYTGPNTDSHNRAALARFLLERRNAEIRDGREERTLKQAEEALKISEEAKNAAVKQARWAAWAAVISLLAIVVSVVGALLK